MNNPAYSLNIPRENIKDWLLKNGQQLPNLPSRLPSKPNMVYVRWCPANYESSRGNNWHAWITMGPVDRFSLDIWPNWYNWAWFEVPTKAVFPFTDAPLL